MTSTHAPCRPFAVATWNMDHWKRPVRTREQAWSLVARDLGVDVVLLQECVAPADIPRDRIVYREIGGSRPWGSAVAAFGSSIAVEEIGAVRTPYGSTRFPMLGTYPGAVIVTRALLPDVGPVTCVSVYGLINVYSQTTMLRIVADLIPLFDSPHGEHVVLGGDFNLTTMASPETPELRRYDAIIRAVEALGLRNLVETAAERPAQIENCRCGAAECHHIRTFTPTGGQLDFLFATPELARRCVKLRLEEELTRELSDHVPIVAELALPLGRSYEKWDPDTFVEEVAKRHGAEVGHVAGAIVAFAQGKHERLRRQGKAYAVLDRLPTSTGPEPELWVQLDLRHAEGLAYTVSLTAGGNVIVQFQHMREPPFDTEAGRRELWREINSIPGVTLEDRLNGRPWFPMQAITQEDRLEQFLTILDRCVDRIADQHVRQE